MKVQPTRKTQLKSLYILKIATCTRVTLRPRLPVGTEIVSCFWVSNNLSCSTHPGYELNGSVNHHVVIRVPRASRDRAGSYACHVLGSPTDGFESCGFIPMTGERPSLKKSFLYTLAYVDWIYQSIRCRPVKANMLACLVTSRLDAVAVVHSAQCIA